MLFKGGWLCIQGRSSVVLVSSVCVIFFSSSSVRMCVLPHEALTFHVSLSGTIFQLQAPCAGSCGGVFVCH